MRFSRDDLTIGDSVTKIGSVPAITYVVDSVVDVPGLPAHVRLVAEGQGEGGMLIGKAAVADGRLWRRVSTSAR